MQTNRAAEMIEGRASRRWARVALLASVALLVALPAWAQTASPSPNVPAAAPAGAVAPTVETRSMLQIVWSGLHWPGYLIILGSLVAIALIVDHFLSVRRWTVIPPAQAQRCRDMIEKRRFRECVDEVRNSSTFFARSLSAALDHSRHGFDAMHEAALEKSGELRGRLFRRAEYLNILGNLGPLMGLLGTVLGMIWAFGALGEGGGQSDASGLALGISTALVNTLLGLVLAVIGLGFYGVCRNRIDSLTVEAMVEVINLLEYFRPAGGGAPAAAAPQAAGGLASRPASRPAQPSVPVAPPRPAARPPSPGPLPRGGAGGLRPDEGA